MNMIVVVNLLVFSLFFPLTAWAYVDPGFGGYLVNSIISLIVTGFAFISAAVIYFFRTVIGQKLLGLWQKHGRLCIFLLLSVLVLGSCFSGPFLRRAIYRISNGTSQMSGAYIIDPQRISRGYDLYDGLLIDEKGRTVQAMAPCQLWAH